MAFCESLKRLDTFGTEDPVDSETIVGAGLAVRFSDVFTMSLDVYRTDWSEFFLKDGEGNKFSPVDGRPKSESNVKDTTQVRLGGEYLFISKKKNIIVPIRAGLFYDPEPSEGEVKDFYGIAVGSGIAYKQFIFDNRDQFLPNNCCAKTGF